MPHIEQNVAEVRRRIAAACSGTGRDPASVTLLAVSKTRPPEAIEAAVRAGVIALGENRVQEAQEKIPRVAAGPAWHLIGKLQGNKAARAARLFDVVHSVDRPSIAERLARAAVDAGRVLDAYVQVDWARGGMEPVDTERVARQTSEIVASSDGLRLVGLMTLPPYDPDPEVARSWFRKLRTLRDELAAVGVEAPGLSMGMTNDFDVAIQQGATIVRVGTAIFGSRQ